MKTLTTHKMDLLETIAGQAARAIANTEKANNETTRRKRKRSRIHEHTDLIGEDIQEELSSGLSLGLSTQEEDSDEETEALDEDAEDG